MRDAIVYLRDSVRVFALLSVEMFFSASFADFQLRSLLLKLFSAYSAHILRVLSAVKSPFLLLAACDLVHSPDDPITRSPDLFWVSVVKMFFATRDLLLVFPLLAAKAFSRRSGTCRRSRTSSVRFSGLIIFVSAFVSWRLPPSLGYYRCLLASQSCW